MIPHRPYGSKYNSSNLPQTVPIVGLGCSSFSTFFFPPQEGQKKHLGMATKNDDDETIMTSLKQIKSQTDADQLLNTLNEFKTYPSIIQSWIETIQYAIENGITLLDTAPWYGHGTSEVIIGLALEKYFHNKDNNNGAQPSIQRQDLIINTKVGRYDSDPKQQFDFSYQATICSVKRSIKRMKCAYIDVIQLHDPEFASHIDILIKDTIMALIKCRNELKIVRGIGLTGYPLEVQCYILKQVDQKLRLNNTLTGNEAGVGEMMIFDQCLTYCHFNLHSQSLFTKSIGSMNEITSDMRRKKENNASNQIKDDENMKMTFAEYCHSKSILLMAAAPLSMGLLTHSNPPEWHPASTILQNACHEASLIAMNNNVDLPTLAIIFALVHNGISCTLLGMASKKEVDVALRVVRRIGPIKSLVTSNHNKEDDDNERRKGMKLRKEIQSALDCILTSDEKYVLSILMDETKGPFAHVWSNDAYEWDGVHEAEKFWFVKETTEQND